MFDYLLSRPFKEMQDIIHRLEENTDHRSKWEVMLDDWGLRAAPPPKEESLAETATVDDEESEDEEGDIHMYMYTYTYLNVYPLALPQCILFSYI